MFPTGLSLLRGLRVENGDGGAEKVLLRLPALQHGAEEDGQGLVALVGQVLVQARESRGKSPDLLRI